MSKRLSRRDFARASAAAGAAAMALPSPSPALANLAFPFPAGGERAGVSGHAAATAGTAAARRRRVSVPPEVAYGGLSADGRDVLLEHTISAAGQARTYPGGWREGTTIPAEYYVEEQHYLNDERFIAEHFWLMADHENRIPKAGDYFVFQFGRGESVIILRDEAGTVKGYHNVCRHRGSRLCMHEELLPSEARPDGKPADPRLSVVQLGSSGNTPVFRCPYHAWTYDLSGTLISFPPGMPSGFDASQHGLHPAHVRTVEGFIYVSFARQEPPDFDAFVGNWRAVGQEYGTAQLKIVARRAAPTKGNWKLVLENFRECYHCLPAHTRSYSAVHGLFTGTSSSGTPLTDEQRARIEQELARHGHAVQPASASQPATWSDRLIPPPDGVGGMGATPMGSHLKIGFVTGALDGKPVAPLLPTRREWTHRDRTATTGFSTGYLKAYDDHVVVARFTPRDVMSTDAEICWLVHPDAKEKDVDVERMIALWHNTYREDRWIVENNHHGILNSRYALAGGQPYASTEGGPAGFVKWYMSEVVPWAERQTATA